MTLGEHLDAHLRPGPVEAGDGAARVDVEDVDRLGVSVRRVRVLGGSGHLAGEVARLPERVSRELGERIEAVEVDPGLGGAVFRTVPRAMRDREFFEVRSDGRETTVERFRATDSGRDQIPFDLTRKQLGRLVDALA